MHAWLLAMYDRVYRTIHIVPIAVNTPSPSKSKQDFATDDGQKNEGYSTIEASKLAPDVF